MQVLRAFVAAQKSAPTAWICWANSRVGARISTNGSPDRVFDWPAEWIKAGNMN